MVHLPAAVDAEEFIEDTELLPNTMGLTVDATDGCCTVCKNLFEDLASDMLIPVVLIVCMCVSVAFKKC